MYVPVSKSRFSALWLVLASFLVLLTASAAATAWSAPTPQAVEPAIAPERTESRPAGSNDAESTAGRQILVRFEPGVDPPERAEARNSVDGELVRSYSLVPRLQLIEIPAGVERSAAIQALREEEGVAYAEPDLIRRTEVTNPNDTFYRSPNFFHWGLNNTGQSFTVGSTSYTGTPDADIDAPEAWDLTRGSSNVTVAVIDSGIQLNHPDLAANVWTNPDEIAGNGIDDDSNARVDDVNGWDFVNNDNNPSDDDGHGTHVSGTIGAVSNNSTGVTGVAWNVRLMPLKACDATGSCPLSATIAALNYAVAEGIKISNNSYGGLGSQSTSERNAITAARTAGHLFVAAAGNDGLNTDLAGNAHYPSNYNLDNIVSVASTTLNDGLSSFSNFGTTSVDLGAPGSQIISTIPGSAYAWADGTSMASPHVAGAAALIRSRKPDWTYSQVRSRLIDNTRPLAALSGKSVSGGTLNAFDALDFAPEPPSITSGPSGFVSSASASIVFSGETVGAGVTFECRIDSGSWSSCTSPKAYTGLSEGSHTFEVRQTDQAGNTSTETSRTWTVDTVAPSAPSITSGPSGFVSSTSASLSFTGEPSATFECRIDSGSWGSCTSPKAYSGLGEGSHTFEVRQTDQAGNTSSAASRTWTVDTVAPSAPSFTSGPSGFVSSTSASLSFTGEPSATFECRIDSGSWSSCTSPKAYTGLGQGSHTFEVRQTDQAGNTSTSASRTWTVDTVAPAAPSITSGPSGTVDTDEVTFEFTGETSVTFECRIDSGSWSSCTSPKAYTGLGQGGHTFEVRQTDQAGNTSSEASRNWTVDLTPAPPAITAGPSGLTASTEASFEFTGETGATFECRIDAGTWDPCTSPVSYSGLGQGEHSFDVRQTDTGLLTSDPSSRSWTVDTVAPDAPSIASGPSGFVSSTSASISFTGEPSATFECRIDEGSWASCTSPEAYTDLDQGSHTFEVRQTDQAGNTSVAASRTWTVDTVAPDAPSIASGPSGFVSSTSAAFSFTGEPSSTFECRIDSGSWGSCTSPKAYSDLGQGEQLFEVRQTDQAGNTSSAASRGWTVDTVAPDAPSITSGPSGFVSSTSAILSFTGESSATFECRIDEGSWASCTSPKAYTSLDQGSHTFEVRQTDQAGNTSSAASRSWTVDTIAPDAPSITSGPSGFVSSTSSSLSFTGEALATFECRIDEGSWASCTSPKVYTGLGQGSHTFEVRQIDQAGNTSTSASRTWTVDTVAPAAPSINAGPPSLASFTSASLSFSGEALATFECRLDTSPWETCTSGMSYTDLSEGAHTFEVRQTDQAGNTSVAASRTWTVDTVAPSAPSVTSGPTGLVSSISASLSFTGEASATFECRIDEGSWASCTSPRTYSSLGQGAHTFEVRQTDQAGNTSVAASRTWTVDTVAPSAPSITSGPSGFVSSTSASFSFTGEESATFECRIDSGSWSSCTSPKAYTGLGEGSHTFEVRQTDQAGNTSSAGSRSWTVDTVAPSAPSITSGPSGFVSSTSASLSFTGESSATFECRIDSGSWSSCTSPKAHTGLGEGSHTFEVRQTDQAGNTSSAASQSWTVDTVAPGAPTIDSGPEGLSGSAESTFVFSGETDATYECRRDAGAWAPCTSPRTLSSLGEGSHTFEVRQTDRAGNTSPASSRSWDVVLTVDEPEITLGPTGSVNSTAATFEFTGVEGATFKCRVDDGPLEACTSPYEITGLAAGIHEFGVEQTDAVGNTSLEMVRSWTVLEVATVTPEIATADETGAIIFSGAPEGFTYLCAVGSESLHPCDNPYLPIGLVDGTYPIEVVIEDPEGNLSAPVATEISIEGAPVPPTSGVKVVVNGGATYTRSSRVTLQLDWPGGTRRIIISNDGTFGADPVQVAAGLDWLLSTGQGKRTVSVQFLGAGDSPLAVASDSIYLDPNRPNLKSAKVTERRGKVFWTRVKAGDSGSGLAKLAISTRRSKPGTNAKPTRIVKFTKSSTVKGKLPSRPRWVKVRDRAGNWSGWKAVKQ